MKLFFRIVVFYLALAFAIAMLTRPVSLDLVLEAIASTIAFSRIIARVAFWMLPVILGLILVTGWRRFVANLHLLGYALAASILLQLGFSLIKSSIPALVPFYADPVLAAFDQWLHGGTDPWVLVHAWAGPVPAARLAPIYMAAWSIPAIAFVIILAMSDRNAERTARFLILYGACWIVLGNIIALLVSSAGPVYYDGLFGGDRFAALQAALVDSGLKDTRIGVVQAHLWSAYTEKSMAIGAGISAFPSVHVGIATIAALYLAERSRWLALPGFAFLGAILFMSVYTGYHYAVDGYFSIIFIVGLWAVLRRTNLAALATRLKLAPAAAEDALGRTA